MQQIRQNQELIKQARTAGNEQVALAIIQQQHTLVPMYKYYQAHPHLQQQQQQPEVQNKPPEKEQLAIEAKPKVEQLALEAPKSSSSDNQKNEKQQPPEDMFTKLERIATKTCVKVEQQSVKPMEPTNDPSKVMNQVDLQKVKQEEANRLQQLAARQALARQFNQSGQIGPTQAQLQKFHS
jgi:hypothetical protein